MGTVIATEFLGHDILLTIDPAGDAAPIVVRQHSLNPPPIDAKVRIEVVGSGVVLEVSPSSTICAATANGWRC